MKSKLSYILLFALCFVFFALVPTSNASEDYKTLYSTSEFTKGTTYKVQDFFINEEASGAQYAYVVLLDKTADYTVDFSKTLTVSKAESSIRVTYPGNKCYIGVFVRNDSNSEWVRNSLLTANDNGVNRTIYKNGYTIFATTDVYYNDGTIFFQVAPPEKTLAEMTLELVTVELPKTVEKITQEMKIILLCGVGCLALLISLPVLSKVLYRFL